MTTYDAIVVGSGITGGWAAKELCQRGLQTLVLERGRQLEHVKDYPTTATPPWEFAQRGQVSPRTRADYPVQSNVYCFNEATKHFWIKDVDHPYTTPAGHDFHWIRGDHVGGKSLMWGRQCSRWADLDFTANAADGHGTDWPIRYADIAPWYDYVERFIGVSGSKEGYSQLPDGQYQPPMPMNCVEEEVRRRIEAHWPGQRHLTIGRVANMTEPKEGRSACQYRNLCYRGCPYGAYFSSQSSTLPAAAATGKLTLRPDSVVTSLIYDTQTNRVRGVRMLDAHTRQEREFFAPVVFLCASTLASTWILLNSTEDGTPEGLANSSGVLGHYLTDQHYRIGATGRIEGFDDKYYTGGRPTGIIVPRFRNLSPETQRDDYLRGFNYQGWAVRDGWSRGIDDDDYGGEWKDRLHRPGPWSMTFLAFGETLPRYRNHVRLNHDRRDVYGLPTLHIDTRFGENEDAMRRDMQDSAVEMLRVAGAVDIQPFESRKDYVMGDCIHEMGTARMGRDPKTSVLNGFNQSHDIPNLFVTDGASMASVSCKNPSVTFMALTARAVDYAVERLRRGEL
jgi:choline dehydrogenase-like flavoprotein